jgi:hypothetical protein
MNIKRGLISIAVMAALLMQMACGTILYPERRGQDDGDIDPAVIIMDGILLLLFIIPGVIAFAVDFSTGAIYLPPEDSIAGGERRVIHVDPDNITPETLAAAIYEETGVEMTLTEEDVRRLREASRP